MPEAKYLDVILYSREQLVKEHEAMPSKGDADALPQAPWGIISIKAQDEDHETPMQVCVPAKHVSHIGCPHGCCKAQAISERCLQEMRTALSMLDIKYDALSGQLL